MEGTKRGTIVSTWEEEEMGLCEIKYSITKCHIENQCSIKGIQPPFFDLIPIIEFRVRGLMGESSRVVKEAWVEYNFELECKR